MYLYTGDGKKSERLLKHGGKKVKMLGGGIGCASTWACICLFLLFLAVVVFYSRTKENEKPVFGGGFGNVLNISKNRGGGTTGPWKK